MTVDVDHPSRRPGVAGAITEAFAPAHLVIGLLVAVGYQSVDSPIRGMGWGLLAALFAGVIPYAFLLLGVRRGRYSDRHVRAREERLVPLLFGGASLAVGFAVLLWLRAPRDLIALILALLGGFAVTVSITLVWKISVHAAVAAGTAVILTMVFGVIWSPVWWLAVCLIAWSRVHLKDHTFAQVLGGIPMGAAVAAGVFSLLR